MATCPRKPRPKKAPGRRTPAKGRGSSPRSLVPQAPAAGGLSLRVIGIDLGLANNGAAVIDGLGDEAVVHLEFMGTEPDHSMRQMTDDWRRLALIFQWARALIARWRHPTALTVVRFEWFAPRFPVKRGWTTSMVVGVIGAAALAEASRPTNNAHDFGPLEVLPAQPPLHVQVALGPVGWPMTKRATPHVLDGLTHARLEWLRRTEGKGQ